MRDSLMYEYDKIPGYAFGIHIPDAVMRSDQVIMKWQDVPEQYQKKILEGTMTNEDWDADWDQPEKFRDKVNEIVEETLVTETSRWTAGHVHVFRKEYDKCMIKGCEVVNGQRRE